MAAECAPAVTSYACLCGYARRTEGVHGFFRGIGSKMVQTVANSALIFLIYERLLAFVIQTLGIVSRAKRQ